LWIIAREPFSDLAIDFQVGRGVVNCARNWFRLVQNCLFGVSGWLWRSAHKIIEGNLLYKCIERPMCH
jgi:hypothetical protein